MVCLGRQQLMAPTAGMRGSSKPQAKGDTAALLDKMMSDAKLPAAQQRHLRAISEGRRPPPVPVAPAGARASVAAVQQRARPFQDRYGGIALNPLLVPQRSTKSRDQIVAETQGYERPKFHGAAVGGRSSRAEQKAALQDSYLGELGAAPARAQPRAAAVPRRPKSEAARLRDAIADEIAERQNFLDQMRAAGKHGEYEVKVQAEIAERMRELRLSEKLMQDGVE
jgi:hypothetical protein